MRGIELTPEHPVPRLADLGARAEAAGFDTVFTSCHYNNRDPFLALGEIAGATDEVSLGPGVVNPHEVHPVRLASALATLDELSGGRAVLGIGPGDPSTLRNLGLLDERGLRPVLEAFETARALWRGERVTRDGTFVAADAGLNYEPPSGDGIPVYVGGEGPHMCRMAAKRADGLLFNGSHPDDLAWAREQVEIGLEDRPGAQDGRVGRDGRDGNGGFDLVAYASVSVAEDVDAARAAARPPAAFIAAGAAPPVLDRHGIDADRAADVGDAISAGRFAEAFGLVTDAMIDAFSAAGTPESVGARLGSLLEHADGVVVGAPLGPDLEAAVDLAAAALDRAEGR
ncbi:5,10-methylenetetrahydromethanopterin reductase [Halomarina halobia]|uniref:5,10-methylenetetrahydromethanopterin reductase n=1 Tax=Halomarina halobia TaxID=3033386 RepID=A0ABD6A8R8_9EURY|nr:5,10-methylenetetrahydromethanopterin reductase [Halomarina sp. PSR21]